MLYPLPFTFRKESEAAFIGHVTQRRGGPAASGRASGELRLSPRRATARTCCHLDIDTEWAPKSWSKFVSNDGGVG